MRNQVHVVLPPHSCPQDQGTPLVGFTGQLTAGFRHTATASPATPRVNTRLVHMTGSNAGVKRNRLPSGTKATLIRDTNLHPDTSKDFRDAAKASGNLSFSLYLERLHARS